MEREGEKAEGRGRESLSARPFGGSRCFHTVLTICPAKSYEQLAGWSRRLGGLTFEELKGVDLVSDA